LPTIIHCARSALEIQNAVSGKILESLFTQDRGELVVTFCDFPGVLIINCEGSHNAFYLQNSYARAKKNSVDLFRSACGSTIRSVAIDESDRQIFLELEDGSRIIVQMFGVKGNVLLVSPKNVIVDAFLRKNEIVTTVYTLPAERHISFDLDSPAHTPDQYKDLTLPQFMKKIFPQFGALLNREFFCAPALPKQRCRRRSPGMRWNGFFIPLKRCMKNSSLHHPREYILTGRSRFEWH